MSFSALKQPWCTTVLIRSVHHIEATHLSINSQHDVGKDLAAQGKIESNDSAQGEGQYREEYWCGENHKKFQAIFPSFRQGSVSMATQVVILSTLATLQLQPPRWLTGSVYNYHLGGLILNPGCVRKDISCITCARLIPCKLLWIKVFAKYNSNWRKPPVQGRPERHWSANPLWEWVVPSYRSCSVVLW